MRLIDVPEGTTAIVARSHWAVVYQGEIEREAEIWTVVAEPSNQVVAVCGELETNARTIAGFLDQRVRDALSIQR